jgi:2,4-dienoyl-CoA reductase-like NADH-dependent reductase (Old Yellow Enzyme family)
VRPFFSAFIVMSLLKRGVLPGMSALTRNRSSASVPNELMKQYYDQRALGGAGLIVTEGTLITRQGYGEVTLHLCLH